MKKSEIYSFPVGSAKFVMAHAMWRRSRNKRPSMAYKGERNPIKALENSMINSVEKLKIETDIVLDLAKLAANLNPKNHGVDTSFRTEIGLEKEFSHPTFEEAFKCFHDEIMVAVKKGTSRQWVETTNYIKHTIKTIEGPLDCVLNFFQAVNLAQEIGLLKNGKLQKTSGYSATKIDLFFSRAEIKNRELLLQNIEGLASA